MVLGDDTVLSVRVEVDGHDSWLVRPEAPAVTFVRGNPDLHVTLHFVRIHPYVVAKTSLTGGSTERTDTRILQVVYSFDRALLPHSYVGQQMDVFIESPAPAAPHGGIRRPVLLQGKIRKPLVMATMLPREAPP